MRKKPSPTTIIENCTFHGSDSAGVLALAKAIEANAKAIEALAATVRTPGTLLEIKTDK